MCSSDFPLVGWINDLLARERERETRLSLRPFSAVNAVIFRERDAEWLRNQQQFQTMNMAGNY